MVPEFWLALSAATLLVSAFTYSAYLVIEAFLPEDDEEKEERCT